MDTPATNTPGRTSGKTRRELYEQSRSALLTERASFDAYWQELAEFWMPMRTRFQITDRNRNNRRSTSIIDSAPRFALRTLASGLHAGLTSPARPWMRLTTPDPEMAEYGPVKQWLHTVTQRMLDVFLRSNLYNALPVVYADMGLFATAAMGLMGDDDDLMRAYCYPIGSYVVGLDRRGLATTFSRDYQMTVQQLIEEFGRVDGSRDIDWTRFSVHVKDAYDRGDVQQTVDVTWFVSPNEEYDPTRLHAKYRMKWRSCYFERGRSEQDFKGDSFLRESGYETFPVMVPRWDVTGEDTYGTDSPGMTALGDTKQLQLMQRQKAKAIAKAIDPPLKGPPSLRTQKTSLVSGDITYVEERDSQRGLSPIHEVRLEGLQFLIEDMGEIRERIRQATYADLFLMLAMSDNRQPVTAREIAERHEEKLLALGPVLERTNDELLDPLVDRTFALMVAAGGIPDPPEELANVDLKVEYISVMAQAQKLLGVVGQDRFIQTMASMTQIWPEARHKLRVFRAIDSYADILGVSPNLVVPDDEAQGAVDAENKARAAAAAADQAKTVAQAGQALGNTPLDQNRTALQAVLEGAGAP